MSEQLGPLEVCCDAPPYWIVRASRDLGVRAPEDVRWLRMNAFQYRKPAPQRGAAAFLMGLFRGVPAGSGVRCTCGAQLPELNAALVVIDGAGPTAYHIGQCVRCRTVYWEPQ